MRITRKGQITIPANLRELFGLFPHTEVEVVRRRNGVLIRRKETDQRGEKLIRHMAGKATARTMTTEQIMELTRRDDD